MIRPWRTPGAFHVIWSDNRDDLPGGAPRKDPNVFYKKINLTIHVTTTIPAVASVISTQPTIVHREHFGTGKPGFLASQ